MANIKSAKKRILTSERNRLKNVAVKSEIKTAVRRVLELAQAKEAETLKLGLNHVYKLCDKAVSKGVLHRNTAARKKSRVTRAVNKLLAK